MMTYTENLSLKINHISRTPEAAISRYLKTVGGLRREDHDQANAEWPIFQDMRLRLARHITDGLCLGETPILHTILDEATAAYIEALDLNRKQRLVAWLAGAKRMWGSVPKFTCQVGSTNWIPLGPQDLTDILGTTQTITITNHEGHCEGGGLVQFLIQPWPQLHEFQRI